MMLSVQLFAFLYSSPKFYFIDSVVGTDYSRVWHQIEAT